MVTLIDIQLTTSLDFSQRNNMLIPLCSMSPRIIYFLGYSFFNLDKWSSRTSWRGNILLSINLITWDIFSQIWIANVLFYTHRIFTARKRSLGQGNIFTPVCHSVHRGGLPQCMMGYHPPRTRYPPGPGTPPDQAPPRPGTPSDQVPPDQAPPCTAHAGRYGQRAGGTHPTGMQSC